MRHFRSQAPQHALPAGPQRRPAARAERGQAIVIIAMAMIGLLAFIGLTVDAGILFIGVGHLRRAVDAAALAASAQFREGRTVEQQTAAAREVVHLNGVDPTSLELWLCVTDSKPEHPLDDASHHDPSLCPAQGSNQPKRKLIRVRAATRVHFAFLTIIGFHDTEISAQAVSEAASVDVVLVIDTSDSMTFDVTDVNDPMRDPAVCNLVNTPDDGMPGECHPFEEVKEAAVNFVEHMNFPYDRVAVVTFALTPTVVLPLTTTFASADEQRTEIVEQITNLRVADRRRAANDPNPTPGCISLASGPDNDPSGCTNTSTGGGLKYAGNEFGRAPIRQESVWVVILLSDGAANGSESDSSIIPPTLNKYCPVSTWGPSPADLALGTPPAPFCRDPYYQTRHTVLTPTIWINPPADSGIPPAVGHIAPYNPNSTYGAMGNPFLDYDTDDFAHDMADFVACAPTYGDAAQWCKDSLNYINDEGGQGAIIYAIGLGRLVVDNSVGDPNAGDALLRYVANVGLDGDPNPNSVVSGVDPCTGIPTPANVKDNGMNDSYNCGNYYFAEFGTGLNAVFESIASRIFTRLTQ